MFWKLLYHCITRFLGHTFVCKFVIQTCSSLEERDKTKAFESPTWHWLHQRGHVCFPSHCTGAEQWCPWGAGAVMPSLGSLRFVWSLLEKSLRITLETNRSVVLRHHAANCRGGDLGRNLRLVGVELERPCMEPWCPVFTLDCLWGLGSLEFKGMI